METSTKPQAPALTLKEFFLETYSVPVYQRFFAWGIEEIQQLFHDLREFDESGDSYYLMGQVIVSNGSSKERYDLVDGQQRATALLILLTAIRERFESHPERSSDPKLKIWLSELNLMLVWSSGSGPLTAKVRVAGDGPELLNAIIYGEELPPIVSPTRENILAAFDEFSRLLNTHYPNVEMIPSLYRKLVDGVILVRLEIPSHEDAIGVFERINNRGLPLDSSDLIKNTVFSKVDNQDYELISDQWNLGSDILHSCSVTRVRTMGYLLRALLAVETGQKFTERAIRDKWAERLKGREEALEFADSIPEWAANLKRVSEGVCPSDKSLKNLNEGSMFFGFVQHFPILLAGSHLKPGSYECLSELVEDRAILSIIASERAQDFEKLVPVWGYRVRTLDKAATQDDILGCVKDLFGDLENLMERAEANLKSWRYGSPSQRKRIRYVLARLSREIQLGLNDPHVPPLIDYLKRPKTAGKKSKKGYDLDHIRPQSKYGSKDLTHAIGNLAFVSESDQRPARDADPVDKAKIYKHSSMLLTQSLVSQVETTKKRQALLNEIWSECEPSLETWKDSSINKRTDLYWGRLKISLLRTLDAGK